jgi:hypothetical protein
MLRMADPRAGLGFMWVAEEYKEQRPEVEQVILGLK